MKSAIERRRERVSASIHLTAVRLTDERGFDGWTMDQLADEVGVSRRTLFNYVPHKMDAVLPGSTDPAPELFAAFVEGGPSGDLVSDLKELALSLLQSKEMRQEDLARFRRVLQNDAAVMHAAFNKFETTTARFVEIIRQREGEAFPLRRARLVVGLVNTLFIEALNNSLDEPSAALTDHFGWAFDDVVDLFRANS